MKKLFILGAALAVFPSAGLAASAMKMVTFFPVPYVAYSKINAQKQMDVGLTSACEMNLGCAESGALGTRPLQATAVNLNRGKLDLNTAAAVKSTNVTLGSGSGEANIDFATNLRIGTLNNGYSLEAADMTVDELKLFASHMKSGGEKFPSCAATGASGAPQVSWQKVKLKKAEEVYLVCGSPQESVCNPPSGEATSQSCPSGYTGTQTRTWNYSTCSWNAWQGTCTPVAPSEVYKLKLIATIGGPMGKGYTYGQACPSFIIAPNGQSIGSCFGVGTKPKEGDSCVRVNTYCFDPTDCTIYGSGSGFNDGAGYFAYTNIFQCVE